MLLPDDVVDDYYSAVSGASYDSNQGGYVFSCSAKLPNFNVAINGKTFVIPGSYINFAPASGTKCFGGIQSNQGLGFSIFGDIFLKTVYAIFDQTQSSPRLGFASQA
jgi:aspergillopepsin I